MKTKFTKTQSLIVEHENKTVQIPLKVLLSYFSNVPWYTGREKLMDEVSLDFKVQLERATKPGWTYIEIRELDTILDQYIKPLLP